MRVEHVCLAAVFALIGAGLSCSAEESPTSGNAAGEGAEPTDNWYQDAGSSRADAYIPPEEEESFELQTPRASRSYVFVANTTLNMVARIDSLTLDVTPLDVCLEPTEVRTLPSLDRAVVLCEGDDRIALLDADSGDDFVSFGLVAENANRLMLNPTGDYALAWYDDHVAEITDDPGNPHDLTLIVLDTESATLDSHMLSVGFGIQSIQFNAAGTTAFVSTEDGLNVIELDEIDQDQFVPVISLGDDPLARAEDREVLVSDNGALAFVRASDFSGFRVLSLESEELVDIELPGIPTDLDLFPGSEQGLAVIRDTSTVALIDLPTAVDESVSFELIEVGEEVIGLAQLSSSGQEVFLYSTAIASSRLTVLDLESQAYTTFPLRKNISGLMLAPQDDRAIIFHTAEAGTPVPGEPLEDYVAKSSGYSLFDLSTGTVRLVLSPTDPDDLVFTEAGDQAFVMLEDTALDVQAVQWIAFDSFRVDTLDMLRPPESIGVIPATGKIYVSQIADTGRITFIDVETGQQSHVTAYQLNRRIE